MQKNQVSLRLKNLPKVSLNKWYSGEHWTGRQRLKNDYGFLLSKHKKKFKKVHRYDVDYRFYFKGSPLDASNCVAMVKLIEDVLFEDDKWDIVNSITIGSYKSETKEDYVDIIITIKNEERGLDTNGG